VLNTNKARNELQTAPVVISQPPASLISSKKLILTRMHLSGNTTNQNDLNPSLHETMSSSRSPDELTPKEAIAGCIGSTLCSLIAVVVTLCVVLIPRGDSDELGPRWQTNGAGLDIYIMNSCDDSWTSIFDEYIDAWDSGTPDSLTLTSGKYVHDPDCTAYTGYINVCNGNYGATGWTGVATTYTNTQTGFLVSATAKLNDYFLARATLSERKYNICHEVGHTFGLPHTDTNFINPDRHECLDYTTRFWNNLSPGQVNFDRLHQLYGSVSDGPATVAAEARNANNRRLGSPPDAPVPHFVKQKGNAVIHCLSTMSCFECMERHNDTRRVLLHTSKFSEACEFSFDGFTVKSHKLLAH